MLQQDCLILPTGEFYCHQNMSAFLHASGETRAIYPKSPGAAHHLRAAVHRDTS